MKTLLIIYYLGTTFSIEQFDSKETCIIASEKIIEEQIETSVGNGAIITPEIDVKCVTLN